MFAKVRVTGKNEETFLPRVLRVLAKQGVHIRSLHLDAEADVVKLEVLLDTIFLLGNMYVCFLHGNIM